VNSDRLDDGGECLVDPTLLESMNDSMSFATLEGAVEVELVLE
jgi:hypothetical protein